jgi:uncharacterized protein (TIGR02246 family)
MGVVRCLGVLSLLIGVTGCSPAPAPPPAEPPDTRAADEAAIRATSKAWSASSQTKDAQKFASYYTEDAAFLLEGGPDTKGRAALVEGLGGMMTDPNFALSFETDTVTVARSGDLAYELGPYSLTLSGPDKKPAVTKGHFVVVWRKQADGSWKAAVDAPVSDSPIAPAR